MNYLAHFHLARAEDDWLVGALLGDYVKGPLRGELPAGWEQGIRLHRRIDALSDTHPLRAQLSAALPAEYRRYSGILLDVCCDHWLSRNWTTFHAEPLPQFAARVYRLLTDHHGQLPAAAQGFAKRLCEYDLLCGYGDWEAVPATLARISTRLTRTNPLAAAGAVLQPIAAALEPSFPGFYTHMQQHIAAAPSGLIPDNLSAGALISGPLTSGPFTSGQ
jgi:acyl carrier protein phosphodiesterase